MLIKQRYRDFPRTDKDDEDGKWIALEARQLYEICADAIEQAKKEKKAEEGLDSLEGLDEDKRQFNIQVRRYKKAVEDHFSDSHYKEREVRRMLKDHGYVISNTPECSNVRKNMDENRTKKYITFNVERFRDGQTE